MVTSSQYGRGVYILPAVYSLLFCESNAVLFVHSIMVDTYVL